MRTVHQMKKSAQDGTTVTLIPDVIEAGQPAQYAMSQAVLTFTATPAELFGTTADDKVKYRVTIERST
jgi:hypothetical protein